VRVIKADESHGLSRLGMPLKFPKVSEGRLKSVPSFLRLLPAGTSTPYAFCEIGVYNETQSTKLAALACMGPNDSQ